MNNIIERQDLLNIKNDLSKHHLSREDFFKSCVQERLNKSLVTYYKEMSQSFEYLNKKDAKNIVKKLNKE